MINKLLAVPKQLFEGQKNVSKEVLIEINYYQRFVQRLLHKV
jgi:hypothetical protein